MEHKEYVIQFFDNDTVDGNLNFCACYIIIIVSRSRLAQCRYSTVDSFMIILHRVRFVRQPVCQSTDKICKLIS